MAEIEVDDQPETPAGIPGESDLRAENEAADAALLARLNGEVPPAEEAAPRSQPKAPKPKAKAEIAVEDEAPADVELETAPDEQPADAGTDEEQVFDLGGDFSSVTMTEIREALEARGEYDGGHQTLIEKQARFEAAARELQAEKRALQQDRQQLERDMRPIQSDAQAWRKVLPYLEQEDWNGLAAFVQNAKQQNGQRATAGAGAGGLTPDQVERIIEARLDKERKGTTISTVDAIAGSIIDRNPSFRTVFGDIRDDTLDRLKKRLIPEAKAGNFSSHSTAEEIRPIVLKHLNAMRLAELARAQKITGGGAKAQLRVTGKLPPISKTAGVRAPGKPKSMQVNYATDGQDSDRAFNDHIKRLLQEQEDATRS